MTNDSMEVPEVSRNQETSYIFIILRDPRFERRKNANRIEEGRTKEFMQLKVI